MKFIDSCRFMATRLDKPVKQGRLISSYENIHVILLVLLKNLSTREKTEKGKL